MTTVIFIVGIIAALGVVLILVISKFDYLAWNRDKVGVPRLLDQTEVRADDLPALVEAMKRGTAPVRYAALIFSTTDRPSVEDSVNVQVSFENGKAGFDWVLLGPRNIEDQEKFKAFARAQGFEPVALRQNGVSYLRVESADVAKFAASVVTEMYSYPSNEPLGLVSEGFQWPQS